MKGFFAGSTLLTAKAPSSLLPKCGACGAYKSCHTPKMPVRGKGGRGILIVGEFPSQADDDAGRPFKSDSGIYLSEILEELGVDMLRDCWLTNAAICRPPKWDKSTLSKMVEFCRPNLLTTVKELNPIVIILLGSAAVQSYIGEVWKESPGPVARWVGWQIPCQKPNVWIHPTYHPTFVLRDKVSPVLKAQFKTHLAHAVAKTSAPWDVVPDWESSVEVMLNTTDAATVIRKMQQRGGTIAFDYENTALKPEYKGAEIVCASLSWEGKKTISYPWHGEAITATGEILHADNTRFIAANLKHEDRWTRYTFGKGVRHWYFDTMLATHVLDNRRGICSLKFQAFVQLGAEAYDDHIKQFLHTHGDRKTNLVKDEVDLRQLLTYCGTDTLLEFKLAQIQIKQLETPCS